MESKTAELDVTVPTIEEIMEWTTEQIPFIPFLNGRCSGHVLPPSSNRRIAFWFKLDMASNTVFGFHAGDRSEGGNELDTIVLWVDRFV